MTEYKYLTEDEREDVIANANYWFLEHLELIKKMINDGETSKNPPCGSDLYSPELWKPAHWRWFNTI